MSTLSPASTTTASTSTRKTDHNPHIIRAVREAYSSTGYSKKTQTQLVLLF